MRKDLGGLYLAVFREKGKVSVCVDYSYMAEENKGDGATEETRKHTPDNVVTTRPGVYLVNNNFTRFAGLGEESAYIVRSICNVLQDIARETVRQDAALPRELYFQEEAKCACSGAVYMFGLLSSKGVPASCIYPREPPEDRLGIDNINFEDKSIKASDELYNLQAILLETGEGLQETMRQSGVRLWTNLNASSSCYNKYDVCNDISQKYIRPLPENQDGKPQQGSPELPKEIDTDKGRELIRKAQEAGFISCDNGKFKWEESKVLLAYFAIKATEYLGLKKNHNSTARWKPFESLFNVSGLRGAKADFERYNTVFLPYHSEIIDALFVTQQSPNSTQR